MKIENEAIKEVGKGLIAFANLFTVLSIVNIYMKDEEPNLFYISLSTYTFFVLYIAGYKLIQRGSKK